MQENVLNGRIWVPWQTQLMQPTEGLYTHTGSEMFIAFQKFLVPLVGPWSVVAMSQALTLTMCAHCTRVCVHPHSMHAHVWYIHLYWGKELILGTPSEHRACPSMWPRIPCLIQLRDGLLVEHLPGASYNVPHLTSHRSQQVNILIST